MGVLGPALILNLATLPLLHAKFSESHLRKPREQKQKFDEFVVEVHAIAEKAYHEYFDSEHDLARYIAVMLNGVNLHYTNFSNPRVSFKLVGVTRNKVDDLPKTSQGAVIGNRCLGYIKRFYDQAKLSYKPDVVLLLTSKDLVLLRNGNKTAPIAGVATRPSTCRKGAAVVTDNPGTYGAVHAIAHELAHTLNAPDCDVSGGYHYDIPMCKKKEIRKYLSTLKVPCIREASEPLFREYPRDLPGEVIGQKEYCERTVGKKAHGSPITVKQTPKLNTKCQMNCCYPKDSLTVICHTVAILDGMPCGDSKTCRAWHCV